MKRAPPSGGASYRTIPPWRSAMLAGLRDGASGDPVAEGRVLQALQAQGGLSEEESAQWLDSLIESLVASGAAELRRDGADTPILLNR